MSSQQPATEPTEVSIEQLEEEDLVAYQQMIAFGFRTDFQGVEMHRPNEAGYSRPGAFVIDDWR